MPVPAPSLWWLPRVAASVDLCPHGDSAEPQLGCVCRAQLRAGLTHEGRFPLQQHQPRLWQPWDGAQSQLTQREHRRARLGDRWAQSSSTPNPDSQPMEEVLGDPGTPVLYPASRGGKCGSQGRHCFHGSTSPTTQLCVKCLAQLTQGTQRRQLRQLFPALRANIPIKWPTKYFLSFL